MTEAQTLQSGKGHRDENFPVASALIRPRHRPVILAFYRFARAADDIADHATAPADEKLRLLDQFRASLAGSEDSAAPAVALRTALAAGKLTPQHGLDLLEAFRRDVTVQRYQDWDALMDYCRYSAMPVGRFVLDVHGEDKATWAASDALCAALQVINHLQDCQKDHDNLDRVYIPLDTMWAAGIGPEALMAPAASPALRQVITSLARRTQAMLAQARPLAAQVRDSRLALEVSVIQRLAEDLTSMLMQRDPLSQRVHHTKSALVPLLLGATARFIGTRFSRRRTPPPLAAGQR